MAIVKSLMLIALIAILSVRGIEQGFSVSELCGHTAAYFNFINKITPLKLQVNFQQGNPIFYGPGSIEFSSDVKINKCTDVKINGSTILINAEFVGDLKVRPSDRREYSIEDCMIVTATLLDRKKDLVIFHIPLIEVREFRAIHMGTMEIAGSSLMDELTKPFLSRALTDSALTRPVVIGPENDSYASLKTKSYLKRLVQYFKDRLKNIK